MPEDYFRRRGKDEEADPIEEAAEVARRDQMIAEAKRLIRERSAWILVSNEDIDGAAGHFEMVSSIDAGAEELRGFVFISIKNLIEVLAQAFEQPEGMIVADLFMWLMSDVLKDVPRPDDDAS